MSATAQMHAEPVMRLNQLTRWYVLTAFAFLAGYALNQFVVRVLTGAPALYSGSVLLAGGVGLFFGGFSIKFLPSSLGGNPHVYSLGMALWSYWFLTAGTVVWFLTNAVWYWTDWIGGEGLPPGILWANLLSAVGPLVVLIGIVLLILNVQKTMESRV